MQDLNKQSAIYQAKDLFPNNIIAAFSTRKFNYDFRAKNETEVLKARKDFFNSLGLKLENAVFPKQVHESDVKSVSTIDKGRGVFCFENGIDKTDALITDEKGIVLCILSADCLPLIFYEANGRAIGITHAGWRGIQAGIIETTISKMSDQFSVNPKDLKVCLGPAIGSCCYEVGSEFLDIFPKGIVKIENTIHLDIKNLALDKCLTMGVLKESINDVSICTKCSNDLFYSYRAGDNLNRMLSVVAII